MSISIPHPAIVETAALIGCSFVVLDNEQVVSDASTMYAMTLAAHKHRLHSLVRLGSTAPDRILSLLGLGIRGVLMPGLRSVDEVLEAGRHAKYPPAGDRGLGGNLGTKFDFNGSWPAMMQAVNEEIQVQVIVETAELLDVIEEVARVDLVDQLDIGVLDLSVALGTPGDPSSQVVQGAVDRIIRAARAAGKPTATAGSSPAAAKALFERGISAVILDPVGLIQQGAAGLRRLLSESGEKADAHVSR
jgi:4-hydroxy-2-oxoheptanedioate aldolase